MKKLKIYKTPKIEFTLILGEDSISSSSNVTFIGASDNLRPQIEDLAEEKKEQNIFDLNF